MSALFLSLIFYAMVVSLRLPSFVEAIIMLALICSKFISFYYFGAMIRLCDLLQGVMGIDTSVGSCLEAAV